MNVFANVKREILVGVLAIILIGLSIFIYDKNKDNTQNIPVVFEQTMIPSFFVKDTIPLDTAYVTLPPLYTSGQHIFTVTNLENAAVLHVRVIVMCEELYKEKMKKAEKDRLLHKI